MRVATYQSVSGAGADAMERLRATPPDDTDLAMDWDFDGEEFDEESKLRDETRKILELPDLPISAPCVRVPVMVGHAEAVWAETEEALSPEEARDLLGAAPGSASRTSRRRSRPRGSTTSSSAGSAATRPSENGLVLFVVCDNLRKGAALNAIQIAELLLERKPLHGLARRSITGVMTHT